MSRYRAQHRRQIVIQCLTRETLPQREQVLDESKDHENFKLKRNYVLDRDRPRINPLVFSLMFILIFLISFFVNSKLVAGGEPVTTSVVTTTSVHNLTETQKQRVAVALNYCKASFYRIHKRPTAEVIRDERDHILNNLNLEEIGDTEIIKLYGSVLDEIGQLPLVKKEQDLYATKFRGAVARQIGFDSLALGLQVATAQYVSAIRTGASSWWDVRNNMWNKETELFKIEKNRVQTVINKSSDFMETFWKLARTQGIPDRWLVRDDDLERFEKAMQEPNLEVRSRQLARLEPFMEYYPPYWYVRGRTDQVQGNFLPAGQSYTRLEKLGKGHFRRDEMLAAGLANYALIQDYLGKPDAANIAQRALDCQADVWQANLACAQVLSHATQIASAEEAIFRNLDTELESQASSSLLMVIYHQHNQQDKIVQKLSDPKFLAHVSGPIVVLAMSKLQSDQIPVVARQYLADSFTVRPQFKYGPDDLLVLTSSQWQLPETQLSLQVNNQTVKSSEITTRDGKVETRFPNLVELGNPRQKPVAYPDLKLEVTTAGYQPVVIHLKQGKAAIAQQNPPISAEKTAQSEATNVTTQKIPSDLALPYPEVINKETNKSLPLITPQRDHQLGDYTISGISLGDWNLGMHLVATTPPEKISLNQQ